ncbi:hypothetical protein KDL01_17410 [Actinospica durhamensis]|uniref:Uncharacterized protein n=1 Tax=Actinospica durhamensis TaxID=1508375 RepID=A0A941ERB1_9ACTN|nr:hypothetical protein [Actinospica durhamensis]MBR7835057.1 hypothetical protein [Actinospica durhamensis]
MGFKLTGHDGSVAIDGQTITVTHDLGEQSASPIVLDAKSISGVTVHLEPTQGQFTIHYLPDSSPEDDAPPAELLTIRFGAGAKEWWDAMTSSVMVAVRKARAAQTTATAAKAAKAAENAKAAKAAETAKAAKPAEAKEPSAADSHVVGAQAVAGWLSRTLGKLSE